MPNKGAKLIKQERRKKNEIIKINGRTRRQMGGRTSCPPGTHMMPDGTCMQGAYHGAPGTPGYKRGGRMEEGGISGGLDSKIKYGQKIDSKGRKI